MKKLIAASIVCTALLCMSCAEEGFVKVFECNENYPYFSAKTHLCYQSDQDREDAEKKHDQEKAEQGNADQENNPADDAQNSEEE